VAKSKTQRPPARRPVQHPQKKTEERRLLTPSRILWPAIVAVVAVGAFLIAKQQAEGNMNIV
jgi:hypothetical protein